jgi:hypothetical protein
MWPLSAFLVIIYMTYSRISDGKIAHLGQMSQSSLELASFTFFVEKKLGQYRQRFEKRQRLVSENPHYNEFNYTKILFIF